MTAALASKAHERAVELAITRHEPRFAELVERELRGLTREAVRRFTRNQQTLTAAADDPLRIPLEQELADAKASQAAIEQTVEKYRVKAAKTSIDSMGGDLGVSFNVRNRILDGVIAGQSGAKISTAPQELVRDMMGSLQESYDTGASIPKAAKAMRAAGYTHAKGYAERIARTETLRAVNSSSLSLVHTTGAAKYKIWMATMDRRTRPHHREANDQTVGVKESFSVGGSRLQYPGDPMGPADEVILCRCTLGYTDDPAMNMIDGGNPNAGISYDEPVGDPPSTWGHDNGPTLAGDEALERGQSVRNQLQAAADAGDTTAREALDALDMYTSGSGGPMNSALRPSVITGEVGEGPFRQRAERLRAMFSNPGEHAVLQRDTLLYRGLALRKGALTPGNVTTERAFVSTSGDSGIAKDFATDNARERAGQEAFVLRLHVPASERFVIGVPDEAEIILAPDTRYLVVGESRFPVGGHTTYDVIVLRPGETAATAAVRLGLSR